MSAVLSVSKLKKVYPGKASFLAVDGISFQLQKGEILGLLGPNGSGKTTTIQMLLGTLTPTSGEIFYFEKDFFRHRSEVLQEISFASTYTNLPWILTIKENLEVIGRLYGLSPKESAKRYDPLLERFGIHDKKRKRLSTLSAGQITRLMLVKAFFTQPKIALLDEPTASLDPEIAEEVCQFLLEERKRIGLSILFTSHKMGEAMRLCDRTIFLKKGKIVADDKPEKLAKSIQNFSLKLTIADGLKRARALAEEKGFAYQVEKRVISISMREEEIPSFLNMFIQKGIVYSGISIQEPSLEDYFLQLAEKK